MTTFLFDFYEFSRSMIWVESFQATFLLWDPSPEARHVPQNPNDAAVHGRYCILCAVPSGAMQGPWGSFERLLGAAAPRLGRRHAHSTAGAEKTSDSRCVRTDWNRILWEVNYADTNEHRTGHRVHRCAGRYLGPTRNRDRTKGRQFRSHRINWHSERMSSSNCSSSWIPTRTARSPTKNG
jgi:hypothetical protein